MTELSTPIDSQISEAWKEERCPIVNGIFRPDDSVSRLMRDGNLENGDPVTLRVADQTTVSELERSGGLEWTYLTQLCEFRATSSRYVAVGGEGGMGSDGFVALLEHDVKLLWLAFFDWSNPFTEVSIKDTVVTAVSSLDTIWRFPVDAPEAVTLSEVRRTR
jgi:hypothetical protein